jgi:hypothetical protein
MGSNGNVGGRSGFIGQTLSVDAPNAARMEAS